MRRTLRADALITTLPKVTCPSPPMATEAPRRTQRMVVPWNSGREGFMRGLYHAPPGVRAKIANARRGISAGLAAHQDRVAIHAERLEKRRVELVQVREDHALARELHRLDDLEELPGVGKVDARDLAGVEGDLRAARGVRVELRDLVRARDGNDALQGKPVLGGGRRRHRLRDRRLRRRGDRVHVHLPRRRRDFEGDGVLEAELLELR